MRKSVEKLAKNTRFYRNLHKWIAIPLLFFMMLMGVSGLLLGWKKQTGLLPATQASASGEASWISLDSIQAIAKTYARTSLGESDEIDRIDIRPAKGIAKIRFARHFTEVQIDGKTGAILSVQHRTSDLLEMIHDGSIIDYWFGNKNDAAKLLYTSLVSSGLILLSFSGFWLWYNPRRIRQQKSLPGQASSGSVSTGPHTKKQV